MIFCVYDTHIYTCVCVCVCIYIYQLIEHSQCCHPFSNLRCLDDSPPLPIGCIPTNT